MQRGDFAELFEIMAGLPVTIRLLDPPLHEFLPHGEEEIAEVAAAMGISPDKLRERTETLHEFNPMLGHRGCRLAVSYPEIAEMQARAIFEAAADSGQKTGDPVVPEIMVPLVGLKAELDFVKARIDQVAKTVMEERGVTLDYLVGTMIELPRAALRAAEIARSAEFFLLRHQRSDPDDLRHLPRRRGLVPGDLPGARADRPGPVRLARCGGRGRTGRTRRHPRPHHPPRHQARHLRRTRRRPGLDRVLREDGAGLCVVFAVSGCRLRGWRRRRRRWGRGEGGAFAPTFNRSICTCEFPKADIEVKALRRIARTFD